MPGIKKYKSGRSWRIYKGITPLYHRSEKRFALLCTQEHYNIRAYTSSNS